MRRTVRVSSTTDLFDLPLLLDPPGTQLAEPPILDPEGPRPQVDFVESKVSSVEPKVDSAKPEQIALPEKTESPVVPISDTLIRRRLVAGALDVAVAATAVLPAIAGAAALGSPPRLAHWPAYALVGLALSFVYVVYSLAFWGRTPGMARAGLHAWASNGAPVSFGQAVRRWLGGVATVALLGLPALLIAKGRRSLADQLSGTRLES